MDRNEIESAIALIPGADTDHEDARDWYDSYGWHLSTEAAGDVLLQACDYDWLDDEEGVAIRELMRAKDLTAEEAEAIAQRAAQVRQWAEELEAELDEAVAAYQRGDLAATRAALLRAYDLEIAHGDARAARSLAGELLAEAELVRLGDLGTAHVWFVSVGQPGGCDLRAEDSGELQLPGDQIGGDGPWWDLRGSIDEEGRWEWDGEGSPKDVLGNSVQRIVAFAAE